MTRDVPPKWASLMVRARLTDPRNGLASMSRLAEESGVHASTISAMMYGDRATRPETVEKVALTIASRLGGEDTSRRARQIRQLVNEALDQDEPFTLHPDAALLNSKERAAVNELIRLLALPKKTKRRKGLSVVPPSVDDVVAADQDEDPDLATGEQEESEHP